MRPNNTQQKSKKPQGVKNAANNSAQGKRNDQVPGGKTQNSKEAFIKKVKAAMVTYDYKDETKDVKAKTDRLNAISEL